MEEIKAKLSELNKRIIEAKDHEALLKAVDEMTKFLSEAKNRLAIDAQSLKRRAANHLK